jgi:heme/copper-type cytochrome/quinol oxidase subunit 3
VTGTKHISNKIFEPKEKHPFHLVDPSQLPFITAFSIMLFVLNGVFYLHSPEAISIRFFDHIFFHGSWFFFSSALFVWFFTVVLESAQGYQTIAVRRGLRYGMVLFIVSEVMFFFAFFWAFFHVSLAPSIAIGGIWPPKSIQSLDIWGLPLVNTLLLLSSGVTITLAHRSLLQANTIQNFSNFDKHLFVTIILGITFLCCQGIEYKYGITFHWKENIYGSTFFVTTGFHGLHVTIGTIFLLFCLVRNLITTGPFIDYIFDGTYINASLKWLKRRYHPNAPLEYFWNERDFYLLYPLHKYIKKQIKKLVGYAFQKDQHLGFEAAAWYWHFVDVVWIFLFITVYWWGN